MKTFVISAILIAAPLSAVAQSGGWVDQLTNQQGSVCCYNSDGRRLDDPEWRTAGNNYEVLFTEGWIKVPVRRRGARPQSGWHCSGMECSVPQQRPHGPLLPAREHGMTDVAALKIAETKRWLNVHVNPTLIPTINQVAKRLCDAKSRYQVVETATNVPWPIIAVIHEREASQSWKANLAQGDPWDNVSIHVPRGRGPFKSWEDAAIDALVNCPPFAARWTDWTIGGALVLLEEYNGLGYANRGVPSPYLWASTDQYVRGKYIADGHYDPNAVDHQIGCAALLISMMEMDTSIKFTT